MKRLLANTQLFRVKEKKKERKVLLDVGEFKPEKLAEWPLH